MTVLATRPVAARSVAARPLATRLGTARLGSAAVGALVGVLAAGCTGSDSADVAPTTTPGTTAPGGAADEPFEFTSPTGDYTITFPGEPELIELPLPVVGGTGAAEAFAVEDGSDGAYLTSAYDYPSDLLVDGVDPVAVLEGARSGALDSIGGTLVSSEFVDSNDVPGITFTFTVDAGDESGEGRALVFFAEPRLYQSVAVGVPAAAARHQAFLDSFTFVTEPGA